MVKSERYTCEICNTQYSSASSIWNHRTKKHAVTNIDPSKHKVNIGKHMVNISEPQIILDNPSPLAIDTIKEYNCRKCNKIYKYKQSRWFHEKSCNNIYENNNTQNNNTQNNNTQNNTNNTIQTQNNTTNNGTINNNTTNNITINNYGDEDKSYISEGFMLSVLSHIIKNDEKATEAIPNLIRNIHFNPNHKNNSNMKINNMRSQVARVFRDKKWMFVDKKKLLNETHENGVKFTENWAEENQDKVPKNAKEKIKDYKKNHSKVYHNRKKILDEITKFAYIYYKNYMENEDEFELDD